MYTLALLLAAGCKPEEAAAPITGSIEADGLTGSVNIAAAFAATDDQGRFAAYLSSNPAATCASVAQWMGSAGTADPGDVLQGGACNLYIPLSGYAGSFEAEDDAVTAAAVSIDCYLGEGEFSAAEGSSYVWSGRRWQGRPTAYRFAFASDGGSHDLDIEMSAYTGSFPEEGSLESAPATGDVAGAMTAEDCPALGEALGW